MQLLKDHYLLEIEKSKSIFLNQPWDDLDFYAEWLAQTYFYAVHTTRIISLAGSLFNLEQNDFHQRFMEHTKEEKNHDLILINDLKSLGKELTQFSPFVSSISLYQTQYYNIQHVSPLSVYGYFLYLEGLANKLGDMLYEKLKKSHPKNSINYVKIHATEDKHHIEEHFNILNKCPNNEVNNILSNIKKTSGLYQFMMKQIQDKFAKNSELQFAA